MEDLQDLYSLFIVKHNLPEQCAMEVKSDLEEDPNADPAVILWLDAFCALWDLTQNNEEEIAASHLAAFKNLLLSQVL